MLSCSFIQLLVLNMVFLAPNANQRIISKAVQEENTYSFASFGESINWESEFPVITRSIWNITSSLLYE